MDSDARQAAAAPTRELVKEAVVALTEMRGFMAGAPRRERDFMLSRIDRCLDIIGMDGFAQIIRDIHHDVMEGNRG